LNGITGELPGESNAGAKVDGAWYSDSCLRVERGCWLNAGVMPCSISSQT